MNRKNKLEEKVESCLLYKQRGKPHNEPIPESAQILFYRAVEKLNKYSVENRQSKVAYNT